MADVVNTDAAPAVTSPKKIAAVKKALASKAKKPRVTSNHPPTSEMVNAAIKALKERGGSSLQAIKKYIAATYKVDAEKQSTFIKKYLKSAVAKGTLAQPKGKGAAGSFKLAVSKAEGKPKAAKEAVTSKSAKTPTKAAKKAAPKPKKAAAAKRKSTKVAAKPPKAKAAGAKAKVTKASPKKPKAAASPMKKASAAKSRKPPTRRAVKK